MREEAFQGYVKRAKRKAQSLKKQQNQHQQYQKQQQKQKQKNPSKQEQKPDESASGWTASLPGWVTSTLADVSAEVDEWYDWLTDDEQDNLASTGTRSDKDSSNGSTGSNVDDDDDDDGIDYRQTQLWEVAKLEGDEKWIEWLETHIWTVSFICMIVSMYILIGNIFLLRLLIF